jgi:hypothetical protein
MKQWHCHCFMCAQCCMCLCIGYYWLSLFSVCPMLSVSLYSLLWIVTVYCVPNVVCVSVFSIIDCHCFLCDQWCVCLCILYYWLSLFPVSPMLSVSLCSLLLIVTVSCVPNVVCVSVLSIIDCHCFLCAQCCLCLCIVYYWLWLFPVCPMLSVCLYNLLLITQRHRQHWGHRKQWQSIIENTETHTPLVTQETVTINNREYRNTDNNGNTVNSNNP